jgi:hypothetical protein
MTVDRPRRGGLVAHHGTMPATGGVDSEVEYLYASSSAVNARYSNVSLLAELSNTSFLVNAAVRPVYLTATVMPCSNRQ